VSGGGSGASAPPWVSNVVLPALNLAAALLVSAILIWLLGADPLAALKLLIAGAFGDSESIGYTLYYATSFIFTGLAVAIAFHAGLFNIGAEGQAYIGGLGVGLLCLGLGDLPFILVLPLATVAAAAFGAGWAFIPAYLQAKRGSHIVITTIMFNFISSAVMTYLLVNVMIKPGQQSPETREFATSAWLPFAHEMLGWLGIEFGRSPLNLSFLWALICCLAFWVYVWHTRWGYRLRALGLNEHAAIYGGVAPERTIILAMAISGALAGFVALNEIMGVQHRLLLNFTGGAGFVGIAVALMGRNHPIGIILSAILFGALYQGGSEVSFEMPALTREMIVAIQGFIILMCGAFENLFRRRLMTLFRPRTAATVS
jgi:simple sugar transport system permease protein